MGGRKGVISLALPVGAPFAGGFPPPLNVRTQKGEPGLSSPPIQQVQGDRSRFVLGNWDEATPHLRSFLGHLHALRVIFLHRHENPALVKVWPSQLWLPGRAPAPLTPFPTLPPPS